MHIKEIQHITIQGTNIDFGATVVLVCIFKCYERIKIGKIKIRTYLLLYI